MSIGTKGPQTGTAYHATLTGVKSSNNLRLLNILIKIGRSQFWWAPRLLLFLYVCKEIFHISWVFIPQQVNSVTMRNLPRINFM